MIKPFAYIDKDDKLFFKKFKKNILLFITIMNYQISLEVEENSIKLKLIFAKEGDRTISNLRNIHIGLANLFKQKFHSSAKLQKLKNHHFNVSKLQKDLIIINLTQSSRRIF